MWPIFEEYRGQLSSRKLKEIDDAYSKIAGLLQAEETTLSLDYSAIGVDETQDFGPQALKMLRAMIRSGPHDLLFVGDGHQRIYSRNRAAMSKCGIDIRGRSRKLYLNYRTTDEIRRQAVALLEGCDIDDLDDGHDETRRYKSLSHGPLPAVVLADGLEAAAAQAIHFIGVVKAEQSNGRTPSICVVTSWERDRDAVSLQLQSAGLTCLAISAQNNHGERDNVVHLATMHRAKGLEFDAVVVMAPESYIGDLEETQDQRKLLYVALTRARRAAMLVRLN